MGTKEFIQSFFPEVSRILEPFSLTQLLFPDGLSCKEVQWKFEILPLIQPVAKEAAVSLNITTIIVIRNPMLGIAALHGIWIGMRTFLRNRQHRTSNLQEPTTTTWSFYFSQSFLYFALMNMTALILHCFFKSRHPRLNFYSTQGSPYLFFDAFTTLLWILDCIFTGYSAQNLVWGMAEYYYCFHNFKLDNSSMLRHPSVRFLFSSLKLQHHGTSATQSLSPNSVLFLLAVFSILVFVLFDYTLWVELFYLLPMLNAAIHVFWVLVYRDDTPLSNHHPLLRLPPSSSSNNNTNHCMALFLFLLGGIVAMNGILLDAVLCQWGMRLEDLLSAPTLMFVGCNLAFLGIDSWQMVRMRTTTTTIPIASNDHVHEDWKHELPNYENKSCIYEYYRCHRTSSSGRIISELKLPDLSLPLRLLLSVPVRVRTIKIMLKFSYYLYVRSRF